MSTVQFYPNANTNVTGPNAYRDPSLPWQTAPAKQASGINLDPKLIDSLGQIGATQKGNISGIYGNMRNQFAADARPTKAGPGSYIDQRLTTGEGLSDANLRGGLEAALGNEAYGDFKSQRDFEQNTALAKLTGDLNKPSSLEQALAGLSGGAQIGGQGYALYQNMKKNNQTQNPSSGSSSYTPSSTPDYSYYTSGGNGLNLYGY